MIIRTQQYGLWLVQGNHRCATLQDQRKRKGVEKNGKEKDFAGLQKQHLVGNITDIPSLKKTDTRLRGIPIHKIIQSFHSNN